MLTFCILPSISICFVIVQFIFVLGVKKEETNKTKSVVLCVFALKVVSVFSLTGGVNGDDTTVL